MQTRPENREGAWMARSARREAPAAKWHGRAENSVCLRGGRWWDPWPAQATDGRPGRRTRPAGRAASPAQYWREAK
jgi:hypothetical protein